jgi:WD40 repeat protein/tetratricopeptide (TPR) repeat protein
VFIDEIDVTRSLPFNTDEFFAAIRQCYVGRATEPVLQQVTFCLLGTATPAELIEDTRISPFNIGRRIEVRDFTPEEAAPLALGLVQHGGKGTQSSDVINQDTQDRQDGNKESQRLLERILYWTGGHPYLTQRLCRAVAEVDAGNPKSRIQNPKPVDGLCASLFLTHTAKEGDDNLALVRNRLLKSEADLASLLDLYGKVRAGKGVADDETNALCGVLKLSGVAKTESGRLVVRNRIYGEVFDRQWVTQHMPDAEVRRQHAAYRRGLVRATAVAAAIVAVMAGLTTFAWIQRNAAQAARRTAVAQQARLTVATGERLVDDGDLFGALPWFAEALRLEEGDRAREEMHRMRFAAVLQRCPRLTQLWFHEGPVTSAVFSPDGRLVVTSSEDGTTQVRDSVTGKPVGPPLRHGAPGWQAAFSPAGSRLVTASGAPGKPGEARVWSVTTGKPITPPLKHGDRVNDAQFSPDGRRVLTASDDRSARIWDAVTGEPVTPPLEQSTAIVHAEFSPDGRRIVTAGSDQAGAGGEAAVWDAINGKRIATLLKQFVPVVYATFSPDGRRVVTASSNSTAQVWDTATGTPVTRPLRHGSWVSHAAFSPDGRRLVTASQNGTARVWDATNGQAIGPPLQHRFGVFRTSFSADGLSVLTASGDGTARVWDATTGAPVTPPLLSGPGRGSAMFSPDGRRVVTAGADGTARVWDMATGQPFSPPLQHHFGIPHTTFSPDGRRVATASYEGTARVWDAVTGAPVTPPLAHRAPVGRVRFSPNGRRVVTASEDGTARVWDAATGALVAPDLEHKDAVSDAAFSPDGRHVVTAGKDGTVRVWDAATGAPVIRPITASGPVAHAEFSPDGRRILTASGYDHMTGGRPAGEARVWDATTGKPVGPPLRHSSRVRYATFSPEGSRVVTASSDRTARVWDVATGRALTLPLSHGSWLQYASFSPEGSRVATASADATARVWNATTGEAITPPFRHGDNVASVIFSSDGRRVVTASWDGTARVWDAATGQAVTPPLRHAGRVGSAAFSPDGCRVVTASGDRTARVWELPSDDRPAADLVQLAQLLAGHRLAVGTGLAPIAPITLRALWQKQRSHYSSDFSASTRQVVAWHRREAEESERTGQWTAAVAHLSALLQQEHQPSPEPELHARRAYAYATLNRREEALADYRTAAGALKRIATGAGADWTRGRALALTQLASGDEAGYRQTCRTLLDRFGRREGAAIAMDIIRTCTLAPDGAPDPARLKTWGEQAVPKAFLRDSIVGIALYRAGRFEEAVRRLDIGIAATGPYAVGSDYLFLAMAHQRLGHRREARQQLDQAAQWIADEDQGPPLSWDQRLLDHLLRREAEALIRPSQGRSGGPQ